ncbi:unnamed protein product [Phytophthora fragariaefolia]|uniref:Unnamed protein product n=1 Tax=Phytophthora fragariaefolia TaxID=1490495 RepID=A0A9W6WJQ2_9STRA|nr:unnamed protein product [Phytophthora fragariaefolia]
MNATIARYWNKGVACKTARFMEKKHLHENHSPQTAKVVNPFDIVHVNPVGPYNGGIYGITTVDHATRWLKVDIQLYKDSLLARRESIPDYQIEPWPNADHQTLDFWGFALHPGTPTRHAPIYAEIPQPRRRLG